MYLVCWHHCWQKWADRLNPDQIATLWNHLILWNLKVSSHLGSMGGYRRWVTPSAYRDITERFWVLNDITEPLDYRTWAIRWIGFGCVFPYWHCCTHVSKSQETGSNWFALGHTFMPRKKASYLSTTATPYHFFFLFIKINSSKGKW